MTTAGPTGFGGRTFRSDGREIFVNPLERRHADGSSGITLGFPYATISEYLGDEAPADLAEYLSCPKRAAAPELYAKLEDCVKRLRRCSLAGGSDPEMVDVLCEQFEAALAKARGETA